MSIFVIVLLRLAWTPAWATEPPPPGYNVHSVREAAGRRFWRGAAPRLETLQFLAADARSRGLAATLIDLRQPASRDDRSGKEGRLSPGDEAALAHTLGLRYASISAMDRSLIGVLRQALRRGDVYLHCMYGVNRTGFATARYARAENLGVDRQGLGERDWRDGDAFQRRLESLPSNAANLLSKFR